MKKKMQVLLGFGIGAFLIWYLFKDTDWQAVGQAFRNANWWWVALSLVLVFVTFATRVKRWGYIVRTAQPVSFRVMLSATQIGFLANFTLPARAGEVIRALVLSRLTGMSFSRCFAFVALDRVTDLFGLVVVMLLAATVFHPTEAIVLEEWTIEPDIIRVGTLSTIVIVAGIISAFVALYCRKALALRLVSATVGRVSPWLSKRLQEMLAQFADGMHVFKSVGDMSRAIFWSLVTWTIGTICYFCVIQAFALEVPWYTAIIIMAFLAVAISVPGPPGFVGTFHFGVVGALLVVAPETDRDVAKAAALVAHMVNILPVWVAGAVCLYTEKLGLLELRHQGEHADDEAETNSVSAPVES